MNKKRGITHLVSALVALSTLATIKVEAQDIPRLLLCIQLTDADTDILESYRSSFGNEGINRLLHKGTLFLNADYEYPITNSTQALATLVTGTYPSQHQIGLGVDYKKLLQSSTYRGVNTSEKLSPQQLSYETLGEVLFSLSGGKSSVYTVAANAQEALITAGAAASSAFWIDDSNGLWATSSWYTHYPKSFSSINKGSNALRERINGARWEASTSNAKLLPYAQKEANRQFKYTFSGRNAFQAYKSTPLINEEITRFTQQIIADVAQEKVDAPALINVTYSVSATANGKKLSVYSPEVFDSYVRTDKAIGELIASAEKHFGKEHCFVVFSTVPNVASKGEQSSLRKPIYTFSPKRCQALTNLFLSGTYGKENWVQRCTSDALFLNRALIERKGLDLKEVQQRTALFVQEMEGVAYALSSHSSSNLYTDNAERLRRLLPQHTSIDVLLGLKPTTEISSEGAQSISEYPIASAPQPAWLILAPLNGQSNVIYRPVRMVALATTLAYILRIRPPTAAIASPIFDALNRDPR